MFRNYYLPTAAVITVSAFAGSCQVDGNKDKTQLKVYASTGGQENHLWPQPASIPVCWETEVPINHNPSSKADAPIGYKEKLQKVVTEQFSRAGIGFSGWADCHAQSDGIRIYLSNIVGANGVLGKGREADGIPGGLYLNPTSSNPINTGLHEFGHILGLNHEMNRRDNKGRCFVDQTHGRGEDRGTHIGDYDLESIMSYCRNRQLEEISEGDVRGLKSYYFGTVATLQGEPIKKDKQTRLDITVSGVNVTHYRYKIGNDETVDCKAEEGYSEPHPTSRLIRDDLTALADGPIKLCVLGRNAKGLWQDHQSYSSAYWEKMLDFKCVPHKKNSIVKVPIGTAHDACRSIDRIVELEFIGYGNEVREVNDNPSFTIEDNVIYTELKGETSDVKSGKIYEMTLSCQDSSQYKPRTAIVQIAPLLTGHWEQECKDKWVHPDPTRQD